MLIHPRFTKLSRYASGELNSRARARVSRHLARCTRCRAVLAERGTLARELREMYVPAPPNDLLDRVIRRRDAGDRMIVPDAPSTPDRRLNPAAFAIAASLLVAVALSLPASPMRDWVDSLSSRAVDGVETIAPELAPMSAVPDATPIVVPPNTSPEVPPLADAEPIVTARVTPALSELNLQLIACQPLGSLEIRQSSESFASAAVVGGSGGEQLETLPNGFRVNNSPSSEATYRVWVPRRIRSVRVELGSGPAVYTLDNSLAGVWWTLHLQSDLADGDNCIEG